MHTTKTAKRGDTIITKADMFHGEETCVVTSVTLMPYYYYDPKEKLRRYNVRYPDGRRRNIGLDDRHIVVPAA